MTTQLYFLGLVKAANYKHDPFADKLKKRIVYFSSLNTEVYSNDETVCNLTDQRSQ